MLSFSVVIPTFNRGLLLNRTIGGVLKATEGHPFEIIVVNDSKTEEVVCGMSGVRVVRNPGGGAASARNYGASLAKGQILLFVDDDILVSKSNIERLVELHQIIPGACFNFNWKYPPEMMDRLQRTFIGRFLSHIGQTEYRGWAPDLPWDRPAPFQSPRLASFFFSIERRLFEAMGGFNEAFQNQGMEDEEFSARLREMGVAMYIDSASFVLHNEDDRLNLHARLVRCQNGAYNKRQAVDGGLSDFEVRMGPLRRLVLSVIPPLRPLLVQSAELLPNFAALDPVYRKLAGVLFASAIHQGYYLRKIVK